MSGHENVSCENGYVWNSLHRFTWPGVRNRAHAPLKKETVYTITDLAPRHDHDRYGHAAWFQGVNGHRYFVYLNDVRWDSYFSGGEVAPDPEPLGGKNKEGTDVSSANHLHVRYKNHLQALVNGWRGGDLFTWNGNRNQACATLHTGRTYQLLGVCMHSPCSTRPHGFFFTYDRNGQKTDHTNWVCLEDIQKATFPKPKEATEVTGASLVKNQKGGMKMGENLKGWFDKNSDTLWWIVLFLIIDRVFLNGACVDRVQSMVESGLKKTEAKLAAPDAG